MKKLTTILILTFLLVSGFAQKQVLQLQLVKGQTYKQNLEMPMLMTYQVGEESVEMNMTMNMNFSYKVISIQQDVYELEAKFDLLYVSINAMGNVVVMSSENENESNPVYKFFNAITQNSFIIKMDKYGKNIEMIGFTEMVENAIKNFPNLSKAEKEKLKEQFNQSFNEETIKQNMNNICNYFPTQPVGIGDTWDFSYSSITGAKITILAHYTLKEITPEYILIDVTADISSPENNEFTESNGMMMRFVLTGTMTSTIKLDPKTCWTTNSSGTMLMTGKAEVEPNDQLPDGMFMDMSISAEINMNDGTNAK